MNEKHMNKKAEPVGTATVEVLVLLAIIVVIFLFWAAFNWRSTIEQEVCHKSVVLRSSLNIGFLEVSKKIVPLDCKTEKICLGGTCELNFGKSTKENFVTEVKLSSDEKEAKNQVLNEFAESMYLCHWMLGEGNLNFMPRKTFEQDYCLICSRFALDESIKKIPEISYPEFYRYLESKKNPDGINYIEYLYGVKTAEDMNQNLEQLKENLNKDETNKINSINDLKINLDSVILVKLSPAGTWGAWTKAFVSGGIVAGAIVAAPVTGGASLFAIGAAVATGTVAGSTVGGIFYAKTFPADSKYKYFPPAIYTYDVESLRALKCSSFETAP